ncbi:hypothetical protein [Streptomyces sp. CT34]|uniref:hypothetical protein n=1 Tax=Streptomyces sp. CT34 TaxID=1553907 RepID=UPI0005B965FF|nr:hypothetical protein [Streptomyces sp. CT34]
MRHVGTEAARLLPWSGSEGKPCFLLVGDGTGYLSRAADKVEAAQLESAAALIGEARAVLDSRTWTPGELHLLAVELTDWLATVHRVAESRGARLAVVDDETGGCGDEEEGYTASHEDDGPRLPAEAFG